MGDEISAVDWNCVPCLFYVRNMFFPKSEIFDRDYRTGCVRGSRIPVLVRWN
jgi:hypothetical protein